MSKGKKKFFKAFIEILPKNVKLLNGLLSSKNGITVFIGFTYQTFGFYFQ